VSKILQVVMGAFPSIGGWARRAWCQGQRRRLIGVTTKVLWVAPDKVGWAVWGAEHEFFDAEWAGRLLYLRSR
jgi:hypothetical protein